MPNLIDDRKFSIYAFAKGTNDIIHWVDKEEIPQGMSGLDISKRLVNAASNGTWISLELNSNRHVMFNTADYSGFKLYFHLDWSPLHILGE